MNENAIIGNWKLTDKSGIDTTVSIFKTNCLFHGKIVSSRNSRSNELIDDVKYHPSADQKNRFNKITSETVFRNFEFIVSGVWSSGEFIHPVDSKKYNCIMRLLDKNTLKLILHNPILNTYKIKKLSRVQGRVAKVMQ